MNKFTVLLLLLTVHIGTRILCTADFCPRRKQFHRMAHSISGRLLHQYVGVSRATCERTCRQYLECSAYVVDGDGRCSLLDQDVSNPSYTSSQADEQIYMVCPDNLPTYRLGYCYGLITEPLTFVDANDTCTKMYPGSHLFDVVTQSDRGVLSDIMKEESELNSTWLGGKLTSSHGYEIVWSDGQTGTYEPIMSPWFWFSGEPGVAADRINRINKLCLVVRVTMRNPVFTDGVVDAECSSPASEYGAICVMKLI